MPTSDYHQISDVLHVVEQVRPASVLDVGVGFGKWGFLCREILDVYYERVHPDSWTTRIDGIEIFEPYRNAFWPIVYNHVHIGDARAVMSSLGRYDLILCCDVIEHFEKSEGLAFIEQMLDHASVVVITTPAGQAPQGAAYGNVHESHLSSWQRSDFRQYPHLYQLIGFTFMVVLARDQQTLQPITLRQPLDVLGIKKGAVELLRQIGRRFT
jgi:2-polyprenyl-3-methyl-5-hydroxy-6-metoxy-1,4-benzoquinol methylase